MILVAYCTSGVCYFANSYILSLTPSPCTVTALSDNFTDEVFTVRCVAAWLFPLIEYRAPIVRTPGDVISCQEF